MRVLLTGASGFIGGRLVRRLLAEPALSVCAMLRTPDRRPGNWPAGLDWRIADLEDPASLARACDAIDVVIHCAGFAHALGHGEDQAWVRRHDAVNRQGSAHLIAAARQAGVRRFVLVSSVKAAGEEADRIMDETSTALPTDAYGQAKHAAKRALAACAPDLEGVVVRPVMVYGRGSPGNLARMAQGIRAGWFPPLPETGQRRSLIHIDDLTEALWRATAHPAAAQRCYIAAHPTPVSGRGLYDALRTALNLPPVRWQVPAAALEALARLCGQVERHTRRPLPFGPATLERLLGPAHYASTRLQHELGWQARVSLADGLRETFAP